MVVINALAHLDRHRHATGGGRYSRRHDVGEQVALPGQRTTATLTRDLGHGAAEIQIDVISQVLIHDHAHCLAHDVGVDAVQLDRPWRLVRIETDHVQRGLMAFDQGPRSDHLAHVKPHALLPT